MTQVGLMTHWNALVAEHKLKIEDATVPFFLTVDEHGKEGKAFHPALCDFARSAKYQGVEEILVLNDEVQLILKDPKTGQLRWLRYLQPLEMKLSIMARDNMGGHVAPGEYRLMVPPARSKIEAKRQARKATLEKQAEEFKKLPAEEQVKVCEEKKQKRTVKAQERKQEKAAAEVAEKEGRLLSYSLALKREPTKKTSISIPKKKPVNIRFRNLSNDQYMEE